MYAENVLLTYRKHILTNKGEQYFPPKLGKLLFMNLIKNKKSIGKLIPP